MTGPNKSLPFGVTLLLVCVAAAASSPFYPLASISSTTRRSNVVSWSTRRSVAFMVPRGGSSTDEEYEPESIETETEEGDNIELSDDSACEVEGKDEEPLLDPILDSREPANFSFLSFFPRPQPLASFMVQYASMLIRVTRRTCVAGARAAVCKDENEEEEGPVVHTLLGRTAHVFGEMYHAARTPAEAGAMDQEQKGGEGKRHIHRRRRVAEEQHTNQKQKRRRHKRRQRHTTSPTEIVCNGGGMEPSSQPSSASINHAILRLAKQYDADVPTDDKLQLPKRFIDTILLSSQTSLNEALHKANGNARFLVVYLSKQSNRSNNAKAVPNLLSPDVIKMAKRRPLGKKQSSDSGSYYLWIVDDDKDYDAALKRLKLKPPTSSNKKSSGKKKSSAPILSIIYPATAIDPSGKLKVTPKVLAQHHCHPPPSTPETFTAWFNTIRKRHLREYAKLQHDCKELQMLRERTQGYVSSMKEDKARQEKEAMEAQKKREEEEREQQRLEALEARRAQLLEELADEPEAGTEGAITIALRFATGNKRDQRRFLSEETYMNDVFDWIDAVHGVEREKIELSTMNGSRKFAYVEEEGSDDGEDDMTLADAGLGKMTALRVSEIVTVAEEDEEESEDGSEDESEDDEE